MSVTCKQCNATGLNWKRGQYGRFMLVDSTDKRHDCPMGFIAKKSAICPTCNEAILAGVSRVKWARRGKEAGVLYHVGCAETETYASTYTALAAYTAPVPAPAPVPIPEFPITSAIQPTPAPTPEASMTVAPAPTPVPASGTLGEVLAAHIQPYMKAQQLEFSAEMKKHVDDSILAAIEALQPQVKTVVMREGEVIATVEEKQHKLFDLLLRMVAMRKNCYLWGEAGSGKSSAARVIASLIKTEAHPEGLPFYYLGLQAQTTESKLMGYMDANGHYVASDFYRAYVEGGVFLLDELELGNGNLLGSLNGALANGHASFPCGIKSKHVDFVCIATGNTPGLGATLAYSDRRALDGAVRDRFAFIEWNTDTDFEVFLAKQKWSKAEKWVKWVQAVRVKAASVSPRLIVTVRASVEGAELLSAGLDAHTVAHMYVFRGFDSTSVNSILNSHPLPVIA